ncbi:hypothetical protein LTR56_005410 [Elasticomyces elasticus]|nr:hypothetical protein LTR22_020641 [Elasticomyces elasticus]KAK3651901.1 hypothetical protein LTR56_005410 [Elasticomyces elasticus]KAK4927796.1 hypothetical protein LTR49_005422 [Elasticomyces elasticus]KAK5761467.1 hypothetical protein LTS12_008430 [Elasticomyces elasticus]
MYSRSTADHFRHTHIDERLGEPETPSPPLQNVDGMIVPGAGVNEDAIEEESSNDSEERSSSSVNSAEYGEMLDQLGEKLKECLRTKDAIVKAFEDSLARYEEDDFSAFQLLDCHIKDARKAAESDIRRSDITGWYTKAPDYVIEAIGALSGYYHEEVLATFRLYKMERPDISDRLHFEQVYAAKQDVKEDSSYYFSSFGYEDKFGVQDGDPTSWTPRFEGVEAVGYLAVSYEIRVITVEHAEASEHYPQANYHSSVEFMLALWVFNARKAILADGFPGKDTMSDHHKFVLNDLLNRMVRYGKSLPSPDNPAAVEAARVAREAANEEAAAAAQEESEVDNNDDSEEECEEESDDGSDKDDEVNDGNVHEDEGEVGAGVISDGDGDEV